MFFVNKRFIKDKTLSAGAEQAFKGFLPIGKFGFLILNLEIDPKKIDVNVHPTKLEIRFQEEQRVFKAVYHSIREGLLKGDLVKNTEKEETTQELPSENNIKIENKSEEPMPKTINSNIEGETITSIDMQATQKFEPITDESERKKTGLFGIFKKRNDVIEENVEKNAIEEIFAYKNDKAYTPTDSQNTELENTQASNKDFEKMYNETFGIQKEEKAENVEKVTNYTFADTQKTLSMFEDEEEYTQVLWNRLFYIYYNRNGKRNVHHRPTCST